MNLKSRKVKKNTNFNLFGLHRKIDQHPRSWICIKGDQIKETINEIEKKIIKEKKLSRESISKILSRKLDWYFTSIKSILRGQKEFYPIPFIKELIWLCEDNKYLDIIHQRTKYLKVNSASSKEVKAIKTLNQDLCKIIGAFLADGSLTASSYNLDITDGHKSNLESFRLWMLNSFGISPTSFKKKGGAWRLIYSNKIIVRYLMTFFEIVPGPKTYTASEPQIIKNAPLKMRKLFARGVLMFDGCFSVAGKLVFSTRSKFLFSSIEEILKEDGINISFTKNKVDFIIYSLEKNMKEKILGYFEEGTHKWNRVDDFLTVKRRSIGELTGRYQTTPQTKVALGQLYALIKNISSCDWNYLASYFCCSRHLLKSYLIILKNSQLIRFSRNPAKMNVQFIDSSTSVLLKENAHRFVFQEIKKQFNTYTNFANEGGIKKATLSAWKLKKNRIPLSVLNNICKACDINYNLILENIQETDRNIIEIA